jgi:hypothetical protein
MTGHRPKGTHNMHKAMGLESGSGGCQDFEMGDHFYCNPDFQTVLCGRWIVMVVIFKDWSHKEVIHTLRMK